MKITDTALFHEDQSIAEMLWAEGFRPRPANTLAPGMTIVYYATDIFQLGTVGGPKYAQVYDVSENEYGEVVVRHSDGTTEADDGTEVWAISD